MLQQGFAPELILIITAVQLAKPRDGTVVILHASCSPSVDRRHTWALPRQSGRPNLHMRNLRPCSAHQPSCSMVIPAVSHCLTVTSGGATILRAHLSSFMPVYSAKKKADLFFEIWAGRTTRKGAPRFTRSGSLGTRQHQFLQHALHRIPVICESAFTDNSGRFCGRDRTS